MRMLGFGHRWPNSDIQNLTWSQCCPTRAAKDLIMLILGKCGSRLDPGCSIDLATND